MKLKRNLTKRELLLLTVLTALILTTAVYTFALKPLGQQISEVRVQLADAQVVLAQRRAWSAQEAQLNERQSYLLSEQAQIQALLDQISHPRTLVNFISRTTAPAGVGLLSLNLQDEQITLDYQASDYQTITGLLRELEQLPNLILNSCQISKDTRGGYLLSLRGLVQYGMADAGPPEVFPRINLLEGR